MKKNDNSDFDLAVSVTKTIFGIFFTIFRLLYYGSKRLFFFWKSPRPLPAPKPYVLPVASRFEHMHIVAGSGYGKTQLLQQLIMHDLDEYRWGRGCVIVIDSQGDMIRKISRLDKFDSYRLIATRLRHARMWRFGWPSARHLRVAPGGQRMCLTYQRLITGRSLVGPLGGSAHVALRTFE
jgi:hypothetical protein